LGRGETPGEGGNLLPVNLGRRKNPKGGISQSVNGGREIGDLAPGVLILRAFRILAELDLGNLGPLEG